MYSIESNITDPSQLTQALASGYSNLFPLILLLIYSVIVLAGYFSEERQKGRGRFSFWMTTGGLITTTVAFILFLIDGLINLEIIIICMTITFMSAMWFLVATED